MSLPSLVRPSFAPRRALTVSRKICTASIALFAAAASAGAQSVISKANNADDLVLGTSWLGGTVPDATNIAQWDAAVTGPNAVNPGANLSLFGLRVTNPGGPVTINAGNTLTLGPGGIDLSSATQNLTIDSGVTLLGARTQRWTLGAGRTVSINGTFGRNANSTIDFDLSAGGTVNLASPTASALLGAYATINKTDFAALDAAKNVVPGATVLTYTANPANGTALPNISGTVNGVFDIVNSNTNGISAFRLSSNLTIAGGGIRFNTEHTAGQDWVADLASGRTLTMSNQGILVTSAVGAKNVVFNGSGSIRPGAGQELFVHQHNTAGDLIFNAAVTQPGGAGVRLIKTGAGRLVLANDFNGYGGGTFIQEGTVQVGNGGLTGVLGGGDVTNHGTLAFSRSNSLTVIHNIHGTGAVTQVGPGETVFTTSVSTYSGPTNLNGGTLTFTQESNLGSNAAINFNGGALKWAAGNTTDLSQTKTLGFNTGNATIDTNGNNVVLANPIGNSGTGALVKAGAGTLTQGAANNYSGGTAVNTGTLLVTNTTGSATGTGALSVNNGGTLAGTGAISGLATVNSGGLVSPGNAGVGTLTLGGLTLSTGSLLNFDFDGTPANDRIVVTGLNGLTIDGGKFNLFTAGTTTPWTTLGTYNLFSFNGAVQGAGAGSLSLVNEPAGFDYAFGTSGNSLTVTITAEGILRNWIATAGGSWGNNANWNGTAPNAVGAVANFGSSITAPSTVTLDGDKTVGAITFDSAQSYTIAQGSSGSLTIQKTSGTGQGVIVSGTHTISAPVVLGSDLSAEIATGGRLTLSGAVSGAARTLTKIGGGTLVLSGANTYSGRTQIDAGAIEFTNIGNLGGGTELVFNGGALRWAAGNTTDISTARTVTMSAGGATLDTNGNNVILSTPIGNSGTGGLTKAGTGTLSLAFGNTYAGSTTVSGGTLLIASNDSLGDPATGAGVIFNGGRLATTESISLDNFGANARPISIGAAGGAIDVAEFATLTIPGQISGTGALAKSGAGILRLTANNGLSFSGPVTLSGGEVALAPADLSQSGLGSGPITFNGGTLTLSGHMGNATPTHGTLGNAIIVPAGQTGTINMPQRGILSSALSGAGTLNLKVNFTRGDVVANWGGFTGQINVLSTNSGDGNDEFRLAGFVNLNIPGAKLSLGEGVSMLQTFNPPSSGTLESVHNIGELSGAATAFIGGNPVGGRFANWTVGALNTDSIYAGVIGNSAGEARLTKVGIGTLTLSGISTYTGSTTINDGTLLVNGSISGSTTTVNGGRLNGAGAVGPVIVNPAGTLAVADGIESLDITGDLTLNGTATLALEIDTTTLTADLANATGMFALDSANSVALTLSDRGANAILPAGTAFTLVDYADGGWNGGTFAGLPDDTLMTVGANQFFISYNGVDGVTSAVTIQAIPEPSSAALIGVAGTLLGLRRRRRAA